MTFRFRTSAVLFCNWPKGKREIPIIKQKHIYSLVGYLLCPRPELTSRHVFLHVDLKHSAFLYVAVYLLVNHCSSSSIKLIVYPHMFDFCFIFQWNCFHTITLRTGLTIERMWHSTVCSFIIALRKSLYSCCNWLWLTQLNIVHKLVFVSWVVEQMFLASHIFHPLVHLSWNVMKTRCLYLHISKKRHRDLWCLTTAERPCFSSPTFTVKSVEFPLKMQHPGLLWMMNSWISHLSPKNSFLCQSLLFSGIQLVFCACFPLFTHQPI